MKTDEEEGEDRCRTLRWPLIGLSIVTMPAWIVLVFLFMTMGIVNATSPGEIVPLAGHFFDSSIPAILFLAIPFVAMLLGWLGSGYQKSDWMIWSISILVLWLCAPLIFFAIKI